MSSDWQICDICACVGVGISFKNTSQDDGHQTHLCRDPECLEIAMNIVRQSSFEKREAIAINDAMASGGQLIEMAGILNKPISQFSPDEYKRFVEAVITGYRVGLKITASNEAPF